MSCERCEDSRAGGNRFCLGCGADVLAAPQGGVAVAEAAEAPPVRVGLAEAASQTADASSPHRYCMTCGSLVQAHAPFCSMCGTAVPTNGAVKMGDFRVIAARFDTPAPDLAVPRYAGFWRRAAAWLVDWVAIYVVALLVTGIVSVAIPMHASSGTDQTASVLKIIAAAIGWLYFTLMESSARQATVGKKLLRLKVTDESGNRISFARANGRYWGKILSGLLLGAGYIMAGLTAKKQALHDKLSGCLVVVAR
jgi:uncharacterized RDD family membrane protein YckC